MLSAGLKESGEGEANKAASEARFIRDFFKTEGACFLVRGGGLVVREFE